jgi:hypothetical protein
MPDLPVLEMGVQQTFVAKYLWVDTRDQHFFIVRAIEYPNAPALWKLACRAPQEIMLQFGGAWGLGTCDLAAL